MKLGSAKTGMMYWPRLMSQTQAAAYVNMSVLAFERHCPVEPLDFGDQRLKRWDRHDIDSWIDDQKAGASSGTTDAEFERMLAAMGEAEDARRREREERRARNREMQARAKRKSAQ